MVGRQNVTINLVLAAVLLTLRTTPLDDQFNSLQLKNCYKYTFTVIAIIILIETSLNARNWFIYNVNIFHQSDTKNGKLEETFHVASECKSAVYSEKCLVHTHA